MTDSWTSLTLIQWTTNYLAKADVPNPRLDAELLLAHALGWKRIDLYTRHGEVIHTKDLERFKGFIRRRREREPLQQIIGETEFYGLTFKVTPAVLIPRPETELLVEEALKVLQGIPISDSERAFDGSDSLRPEKRSERSDKWSSDGGAGGRAVSPPTIMDIGTGSGCIAIALAKHLPTAKIVATDISREALENAKANATRHQVHDRIEFLLADIAPWRVFQAERKIFDMIISNPPYIPAEDFSGLQSEVRDCEPRRALNGGSKGLEVIQRILSESPPFLRQRGNLLLEIGEGQTEAVRDLAKMNLFSEILFKKDLQGVERIFIGQFLSK
jgi:release factor glutamine methyltransferase